MKILILLLTFLNLYASSIGFKYIGEFSFFGEIAIANITYVKSGNNYRITVRGNGTGIIGEITNNKEYIVESIGTIKNGILIPEKYIKSEFNKDFNKTKTYFFDHKNNKTIITKYKRENEIISDLDYITLKYNTTTNIIEKTETEELGRDFDDDMVSMFFNKKHNLLSMKKGEIKLIVAAGSKDTQKGVIVKMIDFKEGKTTFSVSVKKDYLENGSEDLIIILDNNNIVYETKIEGVLFFGDAKVKRVD